MIGPMRAILNPKGEFRGQYANRALDASVVPVNDSQRAAVEKLGLALEKI